MRIAKTLLIGVSLLLAGCGVGKRAQQTALSTTFTNPVIYADVPDMDVIRIGSDYL